MKPFKCLKCCASFDFKEECEIHRMNCRGANDDINMDSNDSHSQTSGEKSRKRPTIKPLEQRPCGDADNYPGPSSLSSDWSEESRNRTPAKCSYCNTTLQNSFLCKRHEYECKKYKKRNTEQIGDNGDDEGALSDSDFSLGCPSDNERNDDPPYNPSTMSPTSPKPSSSSNSSKGKDNDSDKPTFICELCNKSYIRPGCLNNHMKKAHQTNGTSTGSGNSEGESAANDNSANTQAESNKETPSGSATQSNPENQKKRSRPRSNGTEKVFICKNEDCKYKFEKQNDLYNHRRLSKTKKQFGCKKCCESFSSEIYLKNHHNKRHSSESAEANNDGEDNNAEANGGSPSGSTTHGIAGSEPPEEGILEEKADEALEERDHAESEVNNLNLNDGKNGMENEEDDANSANDSGLVMDVEMEDPLRPDEGFNNTLVEDPLQDNLPRSNSSSPITEILENNEADNTAIVPLQARTTEDSSPGPSSVSTSVGPLVGWSSVGKRTLEDEDDEILGVKKSKTTVNNEESSYSDDDDTEKACSVVDFDARESTVTVSGVPLSSLTLKRPHPEECKVEDDEVKQEIIVPDFISPPERIKNSIRIEPQQKTEKEEIDSREEGTSLSILRGRHAGRSGSDLASMERSREEAVAIENRNLSLKSLLKIWNVNNDASQVHYLHVEQLLKEILMGIRTNSAPREIIALLQKEPEKTVGYLTMQIVLIDFMRKLDIIQVLKLHKEAVKTWGSNSNDYQLMIESVAVFKMGYVNPSLSVRKEILENLDQSLFQHDVVSKIFKGTDEVVDLTELPSGLFNNTLQQREDMAFNKLFDKSKDWNSRCVYWQELYDRIKTSFASPSQQSLLEHVLQLSQQRQIGTITFAKILNGGSTKPLNLHQEILEPLLSSESTIDDLPLIKATEKETNTFIRLLYDGKKSDLAKEVTIAVFQIAKALNISNIWDFLFPNGLDYEAYPGKNQDDIFQIALSIEQEPAMREIGKFFNSWIRPAKQDACLLNCTDKQVIWFLGRNYANLGELDKYKIIMNWAHFQCKKLCPQLQHIKFDEDVNKYFEKVSSTLDIGKFGDGDRDYKTIIQQGYVYKVLINHGLRSLENGGAESENENVAGTSSSFLVPSLRLHDVVDEICEDGLFAES